MGKVYKDYPLQELADTALRILRENPTATVYQKFTCANCGSRQTMEEPNKFFTSGKCEACDHVTQITKGNYLVVSSLSI